LNDFINRQLEPVGIALLSGKGTKLAAQDAVVRVVDVAIDDIAGPIANFSLARHIGYRPDRIYILALEKAQRVRFGNAFAGDNLVIDVPEIAALDEKLHKDTITENASFSNVV
jgi:hypothetical protein